MYVPFNELPGDAKIWLYPCTETLTTAQKDAVSVELENFIEDWLSHSRAIKGSSAILADRILCLAASQESFNVGGCSIDASTRFLRSLENKYGVNCFAMTLLIYKTQNGFDAIDVQEITQKVKSGELTADTQVFNLQAENADDLKEPWMLLKDSPYGRFM